MNHLDQLLVDILIEKGRYSETLRESALEEVAVRPWVNWDSQKRRPVKTIRPKYVPGTKIVTNNYGVASRHIEDSLEKIHRKQGRIKGLRTFKAKGDKALRVKRFKQKRSLAYRNSLGI